MSRMIAHPKDILEDGRNSCSLPAIPMEAIGFGTLGQHLRDLRPLLVRQPRLGTGGRITAQRFDSSFSCSFEPLAHCAGCYAEGLCDTALLPALLLQFPSPEPSAFPPVPGRV